MVAGLLAMIELPSEADTDITMDAAGLLSMPKTGYCGTRPDVPYARDGDPVTVHLAPATFTIGSAPASWWATPPTDDPVWQLSYRSLLWLQPAAFAANRDHLDASWGIVMAQLAAFYAQNPDPGTASATALAAANRKGWDEGTSLRRLSTLTCLYSLRPDASIKAAMAKEVATQVCPRYYGPPCNAVHNHGLLANQEIYRAGAVTGDAGWQQQAVDRMAAEAPRFFDAAGFMKEQSSGYQSTDIRGWEAAADLIRADWPAQAAAIDRITVKARAALRWLTQPDGRTSQIGGSSPLETGTTLPAVSGNHLVDDTYGWAIGRWSWTDRSSMFYLLRYGPNRAYHGTQDRPGITWTDWGNRILVEPGTYGSDPRDPLVAYQDRPASQNVVVPAASALQNGSVRRVTSSLYSTSHAYRFTDDLWRNRPHTRYVAFYGAGKPRHRLLVRDTLRNDPSLTPTQNVVRQWFHLDPTWRLVRTTAKGAVFRAADGRTLTMASTGLVSSVQRGVGGWNPRGWHFDQWQQKRASLEIAIRKSPGRVNTVIETTFVVS